MNKFSRIHSVGNSIAQFLNAQFLKNSFLKNLPGTEDFEFKLLSSGEIEAEEELDNAVTLFLYRVMIDEYARNSPQTQRPGATPYPLSLCLYYLAIVWAKSPDIEHTITAWMMSQLHEHPILDQSTLSKNGNWGSEDEIHLVPVQMSNEDLMRIWDAMKPNYRLSIPYMARVVRIEPDKVKEGRPVIATRYSYGGLEQHEDN